MSIKTYTFINARLRLYQCKSQTGAHHFLVCCDTQPTPDNVMRSHSRHLIDTIAPRRCRTKSRLAYALATMSFNRFASRSTAPKSGGAVFIILCAKRERSTGGGAIDMLAFVVLLVFWFCRCAFFLRPGFFDFDWTIS